METGLSRFGLPEDELVEVVRQLNGNSNILIEGIYTHMADASNQAFTEKQFAIFYRGLQRLEDNQINIKIRHCANSSVFLKYPHMHLDAVRIGTLLSGQYPAGKFDKLLQLEDPYHFKSKIIAIKNLPAGSFLGYKRTYRLKGNAQIAVVPVGYSDGLALEVANSPESWFDLLKKIIKMILAYLNWGRFTLYANIKGRLYPVRGKVFMQMALIEIPPEIEVEIGDEVELPVRKTLTAADIARVFVSNGQAVSSLSDHVRNCTQ
jgi:alanine racemase